MGTTSHKSNRTQKNLSIQKLTCIGAKEQNKRIGEFFVNRLILLLSLLFFFFIQEGICRCYLMFDKQTSAFLYGLSLREKERFLKNLSSEEKEIFKTNNQKRPILYYGKTLPPQEKLGFHISLNKSIRQTHPPFRKLQQLLETQKIFFQINRIAHFNRFVAAEVSLRFHHATSHVDRRRIQAMFNHLIGESRPHISLFSITNFSFPNRPINNLDGVYARGKSLIFGHEKQGRIVRIGREVLDFLNVDDVTQPLTLKARRRLYSLIEEWVKGVFFKARLPHPPSPYPRGLTLSNANLEHLRHCGWPQNYQRVPLEEIKHVLETAGNRPLNTIRTELIGPHEQKNRGPLGDLIIMMHRSPDRKRIEVNATNVPFMSFITREGLEAAIQSLNRHIESLSPNQLTLSPTQARPKNDDQKIVSTGIRPRKILYACL